jgi:hypothetical protein
MSEKITQEMCDKKLVDLTAFLDKEGYLIKAKGVTPTLAKIWANSIVNCVDNISKLSPSEQWMQLRQLECMMPPEYKKRIT